MWSITTGREKEVFFFFFSPRALSLKIIDFAFGDILSVLIWWSRRDQDFQSLMTVSSVWFLNVFNFFNFFLFLIFKLFCYEDFRMNFEKCWKLRVVKHKMVLIALSFKFLRIEFLIFYVAFYKSYSGVKILEWISENGKSSFVK